MTALLHITGRSTERWKAHLLLSIWICWICSFTLSNAVIRVFEDHRILPRLKDTDVIELYHLRSFPSQLIETSVGTFSTQTSGLALRSMTTNVMIVLQYRPKSFTNCFLPHIKYNHNASYTLEWNKEAMIVYHDEIDTNIWQQSTFLARINGIVYKNYIFWLETFLENNKIYSPQSICNNEFEYPCFTYSKTWDTFLAESIEVFAALSVRINAIIPPRATELRFLSVNEPIEVNIHHHHGRHKGLIDNNNNSNDENNASSNNTTDSSIGNGNFSSNSTSSSSSTSSNNSSRPILDPNGDDGAYDDDTDDTFDVTAELTNNNTNANQQTGRRKDEKFLRSRRRASQLRYSKSHVKKIIKGNHDNRHRKAQENIPPADSPHTYQASNEELATYYNEIMSCMQEFQLSDFTTALKSCSSEQVAFIHIDANRYYKISPRYPYIYVNEYLQNLPNPHFLDSHSIDFVDWGVVVTIAFLLVGGIFSVLWKMQLLPFVNTQDSEAVGCKSCCPSASTSSTRGHHGNSRTTASPSRLERLKAKASAFSRLWGAMGWYRYPLYTRNQRNNRSSGEYFFGALDNEEDNYELINAFDDQHQSHTL